MSFEEVLKMPWNALFYPSRWNVEKWIFFMFELIKSNTFVLESFEKNLAYNVVMWMEIVYKKIGGCLLINFLFMAAQIWLFAVLRVWCKLLKF